MSLRRKLVSLLSVSCVAVLMLPLPIADAAVVKVFLMAGQSNMVGQGDDAGLPVALRSPQDDVLFFYNEHGVGEQPLTTLRPGSGLDFGPEVTFGRTIADALPDETFAVIKYAAGGTNLQLHWNAPNGSFYRTFQDTVSHGLTALTNAGYTPQIVGMLWTQGEADAKLGRTTAQYTADLVEFITDIRTRYGEDLPFFLSRLSTAQTNIAAEELTNIRTAQENVAAADPQAYLIDTEGLTLKSDSLHFDAGGQMGLGQRFGEAYIGSVPEPSALALAALGGLVVLRRRR